MDWFLQQAFRRRRRAGLVCHSHSEVQCAVYTNICATITKWLVAGWWLVQTEWSLHYCWRLPVKPQPTLVSSPVRTWHIREFADSLSFCCVIFRHYIQQLWAYTIDSDSKKHVNRHLKLYFQSIVHTSDIFYYPLFIESLFEIQTSPLLDTLHIFCMRLATI